MLFSFKKQKCARGICNYHERIFCLSNVYILLLRSLTVAAHELIDTSCCVNELALTSIERVRRAGDFDFYHWVSFAFELYGVICLCGRFRKEHIAVGHILEYDGAIVFWMNTFFHFEFKY